jgi:hypothetical protein
MQHYVIKFVSDLRQVDGFLRVLRFPPPIKLIAMVCMLYTSLTAPVDFEGNCLVFICLVIYIFLMDMSIK